MTTITTYHDKAQVLTDIPQLEENDKEDLNRWGLAVKTDIDTRLSLYATVPYTDSANLPNQIKYCATIGVEAEYYLRNNELDRYEALKNEYNAKLQAFIDSIINAPKQGGQIQSFTRAYQSSPLADE